MRRATPPGPPVRARAYLGRSANVLKMPGSLTSQQRHFSTALWLISDESSGKQVASAKSLFLGACLDPDPRPPAPNGRKKQEREGRPDEHYVNKAAPVYLASVEYRWDRAGTSCLSAERNEHLAMKSERLRYPANGRFQRDARCADAEFALSEQGTVVLCMQCDISYSHDVEHARFHHVVA